LFVLSGSEIFFGRLFFSLLSLSLCCCRQLFSCYLVMVSGMASCIATVACHQHPTAGMIDSEKVMMSRVLPSSVVISYTWGGPVIITEPSCSTLFTRSSNGYTLNRNHFVIMTHYAQSLLLHETWVYIKKSISKL